MAEAVTRNFGFLEVRIADGQRAFLTRDGRFRACSSLEAHRILDLTNAYSVEIFDVVGASLPMDRVRVLKSVAPDTVAKHLEIVRAGPDEIVFIRLDSHAILRDVSQSLGLLGNSTRVDSNVSTSRIPCGPIRISWTATAWPRALSWSTKSLKATSAACCLSTACRPRPWRRTPLFLAGQP